MGERDIRFALQKALEVRPDPTISAMLKKAASEQYKDRRKQEAEKLGGRFEHTGISWYHLILDIPNMTARDIKKQWKEELLPQLASIEESERHEIIAHLARGLYLSEYPNSSGQRNLSRRTPLSQNLEKFLQGFNSERFSPSSKVFFMVIAQLSEYSKDELNSFEDFLRKKGRLPHKNVKLEQTFPVVADWLVQSRSGSQSSRLS
jgi:hypothetical protein